MNHILINNIYNMLAYAFRTLDENDFKKMNSEKFENIYDLFAEIFNNELKKQIKRGLNKEYTVINEELSTIKGKIDVNETINNMSLTNNKLYCEHDIYSINSYMNKIIKTTGTVLLKSNRIQKKERVYELKKQLVYFKEVDKLDKHNINWSSLKYTRNNKSYKMLMNLSYLIIEGLLISDKDGQIDFVDYLDDQKMHRLYEKFILEYYNYHHSYLSPSSSEVKWDIEEKEMIEFLPKMQTDIMLKSKSNNKILIIDAKYYSKSVFQNDERFDKKTFHSNNLYQLFTYVKNEDKKKKGNVSGMLLYAKTELDEIIDNTFTVGGNKISIMNLNLNEEFSNIRKTLDYIAKELKEEQV